MTPHGQTKAKAIVLTLALTMLTAIRVPAADTPVIRFPNYYAYYWIVLCSAPRYFECDYTNHNCLRGRRTVNQFAGVILAGDQQTILAHLVCVGSRCINVDTGAAIVHGQLVPALDIKQDIPVSDVEEARRKLANFCPQPDLVPE